MRLVQGRGYWDARHKIGHLQRYAFLGNSYVFGPGVGAGETLPARTERHLNEAVAGGLYETVNLGVSGYNLWNAWLSFKRMPQVYDAVIFNVCSNDAQLFERTLRVDYAGLTTPYWEEGHPYRGAVEDCFDDVAAFGRANGLPIAVCYHTLWPSEPGAQWARKLADIVGGLCTARDIPFVNFQAHLAERNIAFSELVLNPGDYHPSKLAHDAAARHLVLTLRAKGWLDGPGQGDLASTPEKILCVARDMGAKDEYPRDVVLRWADGALSAKLAIARRAQDSGEFSAAAERTAADLKAWHKRWQSSAKTAAVLAQASTPREGISLPLFLVEEDALRFEELAYVLARPDWPSMADALPAPPQRDTPAPPIGSLVEAMHRIRAVAEDMERFVMTDMPEEVMASDGAAIRRFARRTETRAEEFLGLLARFEPVANSAWSVEAGLPSMLRDILSRATRHLEDISRKLLWTVSGTTPIGDETTIEVTLATNAVEGRRPALLDVWVGSLAPRRPPMKNQRQFLNTGEPELIRLSLPLFYAGQILVMIRIPDAIADVARADLVSLDVYNTEGPRRTLARDAFSLDPLGRLVSPNLFLV